MIMLGPRDRVTRSDRFEKQPVRIKLTRLILVTASVLATELERSYSRAHHGGMHLQQCISHAPPVSPPTSNFDMHTNPGLADFSLTFSRGP
jgi:hypothetical protein